MPEKNEIVRAAIEKIGCDPDELGFVGLKVELPEEYRAALEPEWEYVSPYEKYVKGYDIDPHITLMYGLLFSAEEEQALVEGILEGVYEPNVVMFTEVEAFHNDDDHVFYSAIVLSLGEWMENSWEYSELKALNDELRKLPHVNGFPVYKPHITVGYVRREFADQAVARLKEIEPRPLRTLGLEYN